MFSNDSGENGQHTKMEVSFMRILEKYNCELEFFYCSLTSNKMKGQQEIII